MIANKLTKRYTRALFELATAEKVQERVGRDLAALRGAIEKSEELAQALASPSVSLDAKKGVVDALLKKVLRHQLSHNFAMVLVDKGRIQALPEISRAYDDALDRAMGRVHAEIRSATELPATDVDRIKNLLKTALGASEVVVHTEVDPSLIGGVVTRVGNVVVDGSIRHRIDVMREQLRGA